jgi:hypothetical protein
MGPDMQSSELSFFDRLRAVPTWKLCLFVLGWGLLMPFLIFVGGIFILMASGVSDQEGPYVAVAWALCVVAAFVWSCRNKLYGNDPSPAAKEGSTGLRHVASQRANPPVPVDQPAPGKHSRTPVRLGY